MKYNFPLIDSKKYHTLKHYSRHVSEEVKEFDSEMFLERQAEEVLDVLHSAETLVRKFFERHVEFDPDKIVADIVAKNTKRGYY